MTVWKHLVECSVAVFGGPQEEQHPELSKEPMKAGPIPIQASTPR